MVAEVCSIDLHLQDIGELFVSPEPDPFQERKLRSSGVEEAANILRIKGGKARARLNIHLPAERMEPGLETKVRGALERYCDFKIEENQSRLKIERSLGRRSAFIGLAFSGICVAILLVVFLLGSLSDLGFVIFNGLFVILIWMAIWNPAETFLYGLQTFRVDIRVYSALREAELSFEEV
ncbi:MAG: hypothetical protein HPY61_13025 [Methanotrichaceae archaeon]|nr:hypothetical protein [Methanotrichaceae archaeon]